MSKSKIKILRKLIREVLSEQPNVDLSSIPKNEWTLLQTGDSRREDVKLDLYDMIQQTYAPIGGHFKISEPSSLDRYTYWVVEDLDDDPEIDVAILGKPDISGNKLGAAGNDGSAAAAMAYKSKSAELRRGETIGGAGNWWGEVSDKPAYAMIKRGAPAIEDEAKVRQLLDGDDIVWHGAHPDGKDAPGLFRLVNGWYTKRFGDKSSTKIILGSPQ